MNTTRTIRYEIHRLAEGGDPGAPSTVVSRHRNREAAVRRACEERMADRAGRYEVRDLTGKAISR